MVETIRGWKIGFEFTGTSVGTVRDSMVVPFAGHEDETTAINQAFEAARLGYPMGNIDILTIEEGKWTPFGMNADSKGAVWVAA